MAGYVVAKGIAAVKVNQIDDMTRAAQKRYLNEKIYQESRGQINVNYHIYMANDKSGKIKILEDSLNGFKSGIYSTITSTFAAVFR